ncbi:hypothetical protein [Actinomycetospora sp. TBRC 11914]|uniref:hypothetical protein n=1 Tax=Actinomycetospora sp. TBRC 11914 TaxID=2729387 RepID=UPI00145EF4AA|nr:hypothetical protein [Actinomycetospora sp. TBRC 11914]NMO89501.1 hypothetical protein [Actinomycetospora sp. TBRC 11914]
MSDASVLTAGRVTFTVVGDAAKPSGPTVSVSLTSTVFERIPVVVASGGEFGADQAWRPGEAAAYALEVVAFPARELAGELVLHLTQDGVGVPALAVDLELTFTDPTVGPLSWAPPRLLPDPAAGPSQRLPLPHLTLS